MSEEIDRAISDAEQQHDIDAAIAAEAAQARENACCPPDDFRPVQGELLYTPLDLERLPDGAIVSWLRIAGDPTSRAIGYVRHVDEPTPVETASGTIKYQLDRVTWISPGGFAPQDPALLIEHWPVYVEALPVTPLGLAKGLTDIGEAIMASGMLMSGGTYPRDHALLCAVTLWQGRPEAFSLDTAVHFEEWLNRPSPMDATPPGFITADEYRSRCGFPTEDRG